MSITAIVPVWNGRDLLARLLATLAAQTVPRRSASWWITAPPTARPEAARAAGARVISMGGNAGFAAAVNRGIREAGAEWIAVLNSDVELAPDYFEKLLAAAAPPVGARGSVPGSGRGGPGGIPAGAPMPVGMPAWQAESLLHGPAAMPPGLAWFATGKILDARRNGLLDGAFDLTCRGGATWRAGSGRPDGPPFHAPRPIFSPPWTAALFRAELSAKWGCSKNASNRTWKTWISACAAPPGESAGGMCREPSPGIAAAPRWGAGIRKRCAASPATSSMWWRAMCRPAPGGRSWPPQVLWGGLALRHGVAGAWLRGVAEGLRNFSSMRREYCPDPDLPRRLRGNERLLREMQSAGGLDVYWKLYFLLTGGGAK